MTTFVILAAGKGSRLKPLTDRIPKVLVEVQGKPMLGRILSEIAKHNNPTAIIVVGHLSDQIIKYCEGMAEHINFVFVFQNDLNGTSGAVRVALDHIQEDFCVIFGDSVFKNGSIFEFSNDPRKYLIGSVHVKDPSRYGIIEIDSDEKVISLEEKPVLPKSSLAIAGVYKFGIKSKTFFKNLNLSRRGEYELPDVANSMIKNGFAFYSHQVPFMADAGTKEELVALEMAFLD